MQWRLQITRTTDEDQAPEYDLKEAGKLAAQVLEAEHCWVLLTPPQRLISIEWKACAASSLSQAFSRFLAGRVSEADLTDIIDALEAGNNVDRLVGERGAA